ncbi:alanine--tRNA ligase [Deinococcus aquatilis]|jgi:alanyl-tRNA synthetase|uniref:alanine--tRNA ligase n=1 Tax=Deinococcus aquatilis TaxID=519440 RepID=UPI00037E2B21|nr:alanine--tRNA ligase [Deinococcus aquatilis]
MTVPPTTAPTTAQIREKYLSFFESKGHLRLPSHSLIAPDPTTLFTVAGMQPFKPQFMGAAAKFPGYGDNPRVTTAQKCLRVGDIENVGRTLRHCSLLEMLGNFSFGDYFKREALTWAWEFLTSPEWMGLDASKLYATIYENDEEAFGIWTQEIGLPEDHLLRFGADENFWPADAPAKGPNGPCGPCSEIFYDRGPAYGDDTWAEYADTRESARFLEIWNNVFPQFERQEPQADGTPTLVELPAKNIDTGMGLERVATVVQDVFDFYSNDVFAPIIARIVELSGKPYLGPESISHRVVAEHVRSVSMTLADGVSLSNTGRGYVIRKILRRASRHAYLLGLREPVLHTLVPLVVASMGGAYPELVSEEARVTAAIRAEEERFLKTLEGGIQRLQVAIAKLGRLYDRQNSSDGVTYTIRDEHRKYHDWVYTKFGREIYSKADIMNPDGMMTIGRASFPAHIAQITDFQPTDLILSGEEAFTLYDTYGFPVDLTKEIAEEYGVTVDEAGYAESLEKAQATARAGSKYGKSELFGAQDTVGDLSATAFVGYDHLEAEGLVLALMTSEGRVDALEAGTAGTVVLTQTPFYAEGGGEVGDTGRLEWTGEDGLAGAGVVRDTRKTPGGVFLHEVEVQAGTLTPDITVRGVVDGARQATERHHTATHLLHAALRAVLGDGVRQAGSLVAPDRLRFDFAHGAALSTAELAEVERLVSRWISADFAVQWQEMPIAQAKAAGATALFGEKYGETVRVVSVEGSVTLGGHTVSSKELCGGAHVTRTGEIGAFVLLSDENVAAGVRRIEALAGEAATAWLRERLNSDARLAASLNTSLEGLEVRVAQLQAQLKAAEKETVQVRRQLTEAQMSGGNGGGAAPLRELGGFRVAALKLTGIAGNELRGAADKLLDTSGADLVVIASDAGLVIKATKEAVARGAHAGQLVGKLAAAAGGKGGGRPDMAQAGIQNPDAALEALDTAF